VLKSPNRLENPHELALLLSCALYNQSARSGGGLELRELASWAPASVLPSRRPNRGCALAIDDSRAIRRALQEAALGENALSILRTQDIVVELIRNGVVSVEAADAIHVDWATNHRFKLKIVSFQDLL
jgi:hypothetical protein